MVLSSILQSLKAKAEEKNAKVLSVVVDEFPPFEEMKERVIIGDFSMSALESKRRWIAEEVAMKPFDVWQTPTQIVRDYLTTKYIFPLKIRTNNAQAVSIPRSAPLLAKVGYHGEGVYADIRSAYWQIVRAVGWDVEYFPNRFVCKQSDLEDMPEWLHSCKPARASLVSLARPSNLSVWTGKDLIIERSFNPILNMRLVALVNDVLMSVAAEVKHFCTSVSYINTDGYILGMKDVRTFTAIMHDWGFDFRYKATGKVRVFGVGAYTVGKHKSHRPMEGGAYDNITEIDFHWMRRNFSPFAMGSPLIDFPENQVAE